MAEPAIANARRIFVAAVLGATFSTVAFSAPPVKVYIFSGQSNMGVTASRTAVEAHFPDLYNWLRSDSNDALSFYRSTKVDANQNEEWEAPGRTWNFGYEDVFTYYAARYWKKIDAAQRIAVVKVAQGATPISYWRPGGRPAGKYWHINGDSPWRSEGSVHKSLRECFEEAVAWIENNGMSWEGAGFFWYQGEGNGVEVISSKSAESYRASLTDLINGADAVHHPEDPPEPGQTALGDDPSRNRIMGMRDYLKNPAAPAVVARVMWYPDDVRPFGRFSGHNSLLVRNALTAYGDAPENQPAAWINTDDLNTRDGTHLDDTSVVKGGIRFAQAYFGLLDDDPIFPPMIDPSYRYFCDSIRISMSCRTGDVDIHYTLDGSDPDKFSQKYKNPITLKSSTYVKVRSYGNNGSESAVRTVPFIYIPPWESADIGEYSPGLRYYLYETPFDTFPDFDDIAPTTEGICNTIGLEALAPKDSLFGVRLEGYVSFPEDIIYLFQLATNSRDSSELTIDDSLIIDKTGKGTFNRITRHTWFPLERGLHRFRIDYYQWGALSGRSKLDFAYRNVFSHVRLNDSASLFYHNGAVAGAQSRNSAPVDSDLRVFRNGIHVSGNRPCKLQVFALNGALVMEYIGQAPFVAEFSPRLSSGSYIVRLLRADGYRRMVLLNNRAFR